MRLLLVHAFLVLRIFAATAAAASTPATISVTPAANGAHLITFYRGGIPQVAILQDDSSPPNSGSAAPLFRQLWLLTDARPSWKQRMASAIPFFYHRAGRNAGSARSPSPLIDFSRPSKGSVSRLAATVVQDTVFDSYGILLRAPTRAYLRNAVDSRNMALSRALNIVEEADYAEAGLDPGDYDEIRGRLLLAPRLLGGFVQGERVTQAASQSRTRGLEERAANWDLLRQAAETNGLYVQPLETFDGPPRHAVLWLADRQPAAPVHFNAGFLAIADPFRDPSVPQWKGYTAAWTLDADGAVLAMNGETAAATRMIPLAVYALDYPRVPLLMIDFHSDRARRREVFRRTASDVTTSIFGLTPYSSLSWFAARSSYIWVRDRHGAALNRSMRIASYARLRQTLLDERTAWDPRFHELLETRLDAIALNPFEQASASEAALAQVQYSALLRWVDESEGLARTLEGDRAAEAFKTHHGPGGRLWAATRNLATFGVWKPHLPAPVEGLLEAADVPEASPAPTAVPGLAISPAGAGQ